MTRAWYLVTVAIFVALMALAFVLNRESRAPLPPHLVGLCEELTPLPLRPNEQPGDRLNVFCPRGWMPIKVNEQ